MVSKSIDIEEEQTRLQPNSLVKFLSFAIFAIFYSDINLLQINRGKIFYDCNWAQSNSLHQYFILSVSLSSILYDINKIFDFVTLLSISTISSINSNWFNKWQLSGFLYDKKHYHMLTIISLWNKRFLADNWILVPRPTGLKK